jgi:protein-L-isoaspartate(D-aspartate) O-methyltransferase
MTSFVEARRLMVLRDLRERGIVNDGALDAMGHVPRERFLDLQVAPDLAGEAYADRALTIGCGQTISQPYMVALMTQALELHGTELVLEIGAGSGYQTAILAELAQEVFTIERHGALADRARELLQSLGYRRVTVIHGDGTLGYPPAAPFDRIIVTAGGETVPPALWSQLAVGGILVMPVGPRDRQLLQARRKLSADAEPNAHIEPLTSCRFVPLVGEHGWPEEPKSPPA